MVTNGELQTEKDHLQVLRSMWQFAAIVQFLELFRDAFSLAKIDTDVSKPVYMHTACS
jgi:hypothetical protein